MDKYEYKLKLEQLRNLVQEKDYRTAAEIADTINWRKVKSAATLCMVGEIYDRNKQYENSHEILLMAYDRATVGRNIIYRLALVAMKMGRLEEAKEYYEEFLEVAPQDNLKYVLRYQIAKLEGASLPELIDILEEFKDREYKEEWAFELAYLYHRSGNSERCVEVCDDLVLWFGDGKYVEKALELKMLYQPLNKYQEEKYRQFKMSRGEPVEEAAEQPESEEIVQEAVPIPDITSNTGRFNTLNLQEELAKSMQQILDADTRETVTDTMDNIKKMVEEIPYLQVSQEQEEPVPEEERYGHIETDEEIDGSLKNDFQEMLAEDRDGQISLSVPGGGWHEPQINGQINIEDVLTEWEKTRRAAEAAMAVAQQRRLESAKARALQEAEELMERLNQIIPRLNAGVSPQELLAERYLQNTEGFEPEEQGMTEEAVPGDYPENMPEPEVTEGYPENMPEYSMQGTYPEAEIPEQMYSQETFSEVPEQMYSQETFSEIPEQMYPQETFSEVPEQAYVQEEISEIAESYPELPQTIPDTELSQVSEVPELSQVSEVPGAVLEPAVHPEAEVPGAVLEPAAHPETEVQELPLNMEEPRIPEEKSPIPEEEPRIQEEKSPVPEEEPRIPEEKSPIPEEEPRIPAAENLEAVEIPEAAAEKKDAERYLASVFQAAKAAREEKNQVPLKPVAEAGMEAKEIAVPVPEVRTGPEEMAIPEVRTEPEEPMIPEMRTRPEEPMIPEVRIGPEEMAIPEVRTELEEETSYIPVVKTTSPGEHEGIPEIRLEPAEEPVRKLSEEQKEIFSYFVPVTGMEQQLCQVLEGALHRKGKDSSSASGNILIMGGRGSGKTVLATDIIKAVQKSGGHPAGKVGKITGESLNQKDLSQLLKKIAGGYLIIEKAGEISPETATRLSLLMEQNTDGLLFILEDTRKGIEKVLSQDVNFAKKFTERIKIPVFTSDELVEFAKAYAEEQECEIDDMGILALYNRISNIQKLDEATTLTEVKEIVDMAISSAERGGLKKLFGGKKFSPEGYLYLREKDFEE